MAIRQKATEITMRQAALIAGISIVTMTVAAVVATDLAIGSLVEPDNSAATLENILSDKLLFRVGVFSWLIILITDVLVAWGLYIFLQPVNKGLSLITAWLRIIYTAMLGIAISNLIHVTQLIDSDYSVIFSLEQLEFQVLFLIEAFDDFWSYGLIVFGLHILLLGYLALKSVYIPKLLAILLIIGAVGYIFIHISNLLLPQYQSFIEVLGWIFILPMLSEVALGVWLLVKGKNVQLTA